VRRWLDGCERLLTLVAALATFIMMLLTTADAFGRYLLNRPILAAYELTTNYLMVAAIFLAMPYAYRLGANIRVTFLAERLRGKVKLAIDYAVQIVSILYCITSLGFDPIWFGVMSMLMLSMGLVFPPVGMIAFVVASSANVSLVKVYTGTSILMIALVLTTVLLMVFPQIALWLPATMK